MFVNDGSTQATISLTRDEAFDLAQRLMPRAEFTTDTDEELRLAARMIRIWLPEAYPANERGQVHFVRAVMESVASTIESVVDGKSKEDGGGPIAA
ncbi:hypothetical protein [Rhizobium sp. NZLR11]|uniref:hypothetical protein n=1 Tax=Rhizobium sp. NZLR11 TaxID=2731098 RepID=UPI001C83C3D3|nr:hypothetical protein [Rhizobium sp. NZLR11]MBX5206725.1 hypothetical protein [Rhizobium sp. NZLR11]